LLVASAPHLSASLTHDFGMRYFDNHPIELMQPESNCSWSQRALLDSVR
jgi:hypothetical protein